MNDPIAAPWTRTRLTERLGIVFPIVQGPLGGLSSQRLTAAVSNYGGLGSFGAHGLGATAIEDVIAEIRTRTDRPFAMNLWVSMEDERARASDEAAFHRSLGPLAPWIRSLGGTLPQYSAYTPTSFDAQVRVILDQNVPVFSFVFGIPPREILDECRAKRIVTLGTATTPNEAMTLQEAGVDVIVASGFEAGGHRGSFLRGSDDSLFGTFSLVPQVVDRVEVPVIAAGGIGDSRGILAALALGADGVQIGTAFLACEESGASPLHRQEILEGRGGETALTRGFTGRLARGIENRLLEVLRAPEVELLPYPLQRFLVRHLTHLAEPAGRTDLFPMWAGQSANLARHTSAARLLDDLVFGVSRGVELLAPRKA